MITGFRCQRYRRVLPRTDVIATINASISAFYRRVSWYFTNLSCIATGNHSSRKGFKAFKQERDLQPERETNKPAPRRRGKKRSLTSSSGKRMTIFLDLDETLVHASRDPGPLGYDFIIRPEIYGPLTKFCVVKRSGVDEFLAEMSKRYEVVVSTAALKEYAKLVVDRLDPRGDLVAHRLYREACREVGGRLVKDLSRTRREPGDVVIVDDNPNSYALQPDNAIRISRFTCDGRDRELARLVGFFLF